MHRDGRLAHDVALFRGLGYFWAIYQLPVQNLTLFYCMATAISYKRDISRLCRLVFEIWRGTDSLIDDRRGDLNRRLSHCTVNGRA